MRDDLRLGLVGCGRIAVRGYIPAIAHVSGAQLAAVADPASERCARAAPRIPAFAGVAELIATGGVDALILATPAEAHLADARLAAEAGLATLIEKPPAPTLAEAVALAGLEPSPNLGFNRRFVPGVASLRTVVHEVSPIRIDLELHSRSASWGSYVADDDALLNLGPHLIDLARWLSGAEIVRARGAVTPARAAIELELADGRGIARVTCASNRRYRERVLVTDGDGNVVGCYSTGGMASAVRQRLRGTSADHPLVPSLARQLAEFCRAVRGEPAPALAGAADGIALMATVEAARTSAARGGAWEPVDPPDSTI